MLRTISCLLMMTLASAFTPGTPRWGVVTRAAPLSMFSSDTPKGLKEGDDSETSTMQSSSVITEEIMQVEEPKAVYRNLARGGEITEVPWVDDAMEANTKPWEMSWWAYLLCGLPVTLLANDFLHFLPKEGPLAFLTTL